MATAEKSPQFDRLLTRKLIKTVHKTPANETFWTGSSAAPQYFQVEHKFCNTLVLFIAKDEIKWTRVVTYLTELLIKGSRFVIDKRLNKRIK